MYASIAKQSPTNTELNTSMHTINVGDGRRLVWENVMVTMIFRRHTTLFNLLRLELRSSRVLSVSFSVDC